MIRLEKAETMPPKLDPKEPTERLNMFIPRSLMQQINEWRAAHGFVTKSEAARQLIEKGLFSSVSQKGRKHD